jgi:predicted porin
MKKSLIALAALATVATAAQAQSSVTIYGVMDMGVASVSGVATGATTTAGAATSRVTGLQNGGLATSRLGFRGTEDLGGGLKANFNLEAEVLGDTGSQKSTADALFARASWVGLSGNQGEVQLGRMNTFAYGQGAKFDAMGGNNFGGYIASGVYGYVRIENAVTYLSPKVNGVQLGLQTGTRTASASYPGSTITNYGEVAGETGGNRNTAGMLTYDNGPLEASLTYGEQKDSAGLKMSDVTTAFARYSFGNVKVVVGHMYQATQRKADSGAGTSTAVSGTDTTKTKNTFVGANYSLAANLTLNGIFQQIETTTVAGVNQKPQIYSAGLNYALSKRTTVYGLVAQSNQDNGSKQSFVNGGKFNYTNSAGTDTAGLAAVADKNMTGWMVGVRHTF